MDALIYEIVSSQLDVLHIAYFEAVTALPSPPKVEGATIEERKAAFIATRPEREAHRTKIDILHKELRENIAKVCSDWGVTELEILDESFRRVSHW